MACIRGVMSGNAVVSGLAVFSDARFGIIHYLQPLVAYACGIFLIDAKFHARRVLCCRIYCERRLSHKVAAVAPNFSQANASRVG